MGLFTVDELREVISVKVLAGDPSPTMPSVVFGALLPIPDQYAEAISSSRCEGSGSTDISSCRPYSQRGDRRHRS